MQPPVVIALVNGTELVRHGLTTMLSPFHQRIHVVDLDPQRSRPQLRVDLALFDPYGHDHLGLDRVTALTRTPSVAAIAVFTSWATVQQCDAALAAGASGVLSKNARAIELAQAVLMVTSGQPVVSEEFRAAADAHAAADAFGLTPREQDVAALLVRGLSNKELAAALWISEHTVKTHLKAIFHKTASTSRRRRSTSPAITASRSAGSRRPSHAQRQRPWPPRTRLPERG